MDSGSDRPRLSFALYVIGAVGMLALLVVADKAGDRVQQVRLAAVGWWLLAEGFRLWIGFGRRRRAHRYSRFSAMRWDGR